MTAPLRYVVLGAGAVGGALGGRLTQAGRDTLLVARGAHLAAMRSVGLRLRTPTEDLRVPVAVAGGPDEVQLGPDDVLVVAAKTPQVPDLLSAWADVPVVGDSGPLGTAGQRLPVFTATNGVAAEAMAARYFERVFAVCVWMPVVHLEPGEVVVRGAPASGMLHLGRVPRAAADPADADLLARVAVDWRAATFDVRLPADVTAWKYRKLVSNVGNAVQALAGFGPGVTSLVARAEAEARRVLDGAGTAYTDDAEEAAARAAGFTMRPVPGVPTDTGGSTWQSLARGTGSVETDYLNGEVALLARRHGLRAPLNATLATLARQAARRGDPPGALAPDDLARLLDAAEPGR